MLANKVSDQPFKLMKDLFSIVFKLTDFGRYILCL